MDDPSLIRTVISFFESTLFIIFSGVSIILVVIGVIYKITCSVIGLTPIVLRLGKALWNRKVAIFGSVESYASLSASLVDSKIIKEKNIVHIQSDNIEKAKSRTIFLVDWATFGDRIDQVFSARNSYQTAIIIFAKPQSIPNEVMDEIANRPNTVVVNFRGRLLNDILTSLITTSYE